MPNLTVAIYLTDKEYVKYVSHKNEIHTMVREMVKKNLENR